MSQDQPTLPTLAEILGVLTENPESSAKDLHKLLNTPPGTCTLEYIALQLTSAMHQGLATVEHGTNSWKYIGEEIVCVG